MVETEVSLIHLPLSGWNNSNRYGRFMMVAKDQVARLGGATAIEKVVGTTALKALDEYN